MNSMDNDQSFSSDYFIQMSETDNDRSFSIRPDPDESSQDCHRSRMKLLSVQKRDTLAATQRKNYIDISMAKEKVPVTIVSKIRTKWWKNFDFSNNYITWPQVENGKLDNYLLSKEYSCRCGWIVCQYEKCRCLQEHIQRVECNKNCTCWELCPNRTLQNGITKLLEVRYINKTKGFGLFTLVPIMKGEFVCEYVGMIITKYEAEKRMFNNKIRKKSNYILQVREIFDKVVLSTYIDSSVFGNASRFINHSCDPNLFFDLRRVEHFIPRVGFYSKKRIEAGEELTFMYCESNEEGDNFSGKKCECGADGCIGYIPN